MRFQSTAAAAFSASRQGIFLRSCRAHKERSVMSLQATVYIYELVNDEVKVDKVEFSKDS